MTMFMIISTTVIMTAFLMALFFWAIPIVRSQRKG